MSLVIYALGVDTQTDKYTNISTFAQKCFQETRHAPPAPGLKIVQTALYL